MRSEARPPPPETGTTYRATGPSAPPSHSWRPHLPYLTQALHGDDSGSVLKFLGTHRRRGEGLWAPASPPPTRPVPRNTPFPPPGKREVIGRAGQPETLGRTQRTESSQRGGKVVARSRGLSRPPFLHSSLMILRFQTFKPGGHRTRGHGKGGPQRRCGFQLSTAVPAPNLPRDMPAQCSAGARCLPRLPPSLPPAPAGTAPGASAGASTPCPSVPDDAGGGQRSGPAPAEAADAAGRGRTPGQSCTSPWPTTNDKGNGQAREGGVAAPTYGPPGPWPHTRAARPLVHALVRVARGSVASAS